MPRQRRNAKLDTRTARKSLPAGTIHWNVLQKGLTLGYRPGKHGGSWIEKLVFEKHRDQKTLGAADDNDEADGTLILNYAQAVAGAQEWFKSQTRAILGLSVNVEGYTVGDAARDYMVWFDAHKKSVRETQTTIDAFILPAFGGRLLTRMNTRDMRAWLVALAKAPPRLRMTPGHSQAFRDTSDDHEAERRRQASANRILTVLKALLNHAFRDGKISDDSEWRRVKPFPNVDRARLEWLTAKEWAKLIRACPPDFRALVKAALFTGARYSEICRLRCSDFSPDAGTLTVRETKAGKPREVYLTDEGKEFFAAAIKKKTPNDLIFTHEGGHVWGKSHQFRPIEAACTKAKIKQIGFHVLRHTYASHAIMNGAPLAVVAKNLGHTDERMVIKHYGHMADDYMKKAINDSALKVGGRTKRRNGKKEG